MLRVSITNEIISRLWSNEFIFNLLFYLTQKWSKLGVKLNSTLGE